MFLWNDSLLQITTSFPEKMKLSRDPLKWSLNLRMKFYFDKCSYLEIVLGFFFHTIHIMNQDSMNG